MKKYDFVAIGDITTDEFIRIKDAKVNCDIDNENCQLCVSFGDKIPYEFAEMVSAVGNSPNAAVSAARLGLSSALASNLGDDENGKNCLKTLEGNQVMLDLMKIHEGKTTNHHYVLWYESERTILIKHENYDYKLPDMGETKWMYLSSMGENSLNFHEEIGDYLAKHPSVKLAFQPGTFQIVLGPKKLKKIYEHTEIFFCNKDEAQRILESKEEDIKILLKGIRGLGPKIAIITDGPKGAHADDGKNIFVVPVYPDPKPPLERTGAGDAFSSTVTSAVALGKPLEEALLWGPINSMSVVQDIGAQKGLLSRKDLEKYLEDAPNNYKIRVLS